MNSFVNLMRAVGLAMILAVAAPVIGNGVPLFGADSAQATTIRVIVVRGNNRVDATAVRNYLTIKPGKPFGAADIDASIKSLFATGLFSDVTITPSGSRLIVTVVENPIVNQVLIQGNKKVKSKILITLITLKPRGVMTQAKLQGDAQRIKGYYAHTGRAEAVVTPQVTELPNNRVDVTFVINEGDRTGVKTISFVGNHAFSSMRLRGIIETRQTNLLSWLNRRDVYSSERVATDQEDLRRFYMSHGYADFRVLSADAQIDPKSGKYHLVYTLDEGEKYKFGEVHVDSSIPGLDAATLQSVVATQSGDTFDSTMVEKTIEDLTVALAERGYAFAQVRPRGDRDYTNHTIAITYLIDEGPRVYVERIDIHGNEKTRDYVIRREFDISEGDAYNRVLVDKAKRRLKSLGYFKVVTITTEPGSAPDKVILDVTVIEQSTGSFAIAAGVSTTDGFIAEVSMNEKNFLGRGQKLRVAVGSGQNDRTYDLAFTDPYFLGSRTSFGFNVYRHESTSSTLRPFNTEVTGGGIRIGLPITDNWSVTFNGDLSQETVSSNSGCPPTTTPANANCVYFPEMSTITSSIGYASVYSTIDNRQDPHEGMYFKFSQDFAGVGGDVQYVRTVADARVYHEILPGSDYISLFHVSAGNITGWGGSGVRIADNFFKGGETVRGFEALGWGPRDTGTGLALGGRNFVAASAEVQFPIPMLPPDFGLRGAVFADAGVLWGVDTPSGCGGAVPPCAIVDDGAIRSSVGASILWASPLGALRADFAQVIDKQSYDKTQFFRISAGTQF